LSDAAASPKRRIREKIEFLKAADPAQALRAFFGSLGAEVCSRPQEVGVKSLPLILISQLPRSGGSLLSQLFDGHPELLVYPWEMKIGYPSKNQWPRLELHNKPAHLFATLFHTELAYMARKGYRKSGKAKHQQKRLKFSYSPMEHYENFVRLLGRAPTPRRVFDTYFSTFFQAWQPETSSATYIAGFVPRMAMHPESIALFFTDYPDGRLISILRDPADWFASRRAHTKSGEVRYGDVKEEMVLWDQMAAQALHYSKEYGDRFLLLSFRDLVSDREGTMRRVCTWAGIDFDPSLLNQTFEGKLIHPNTNFHDPPEQLAAAALDRKLRLSADERAHAYELTEHHRKQLQHAGWIG
jgi:hypothetical protein